NRDDPLSPEERDEYERDLIAFCDRELDLLGDISGKRVLYAGGTSPLWIEGLAEKIGPEGSLTAIDTDEEGLEVARESFDPDELPLVPEYVFGNIFDPPFEDHPFNLVYSSGLLHELDVSGREEGILEALWNLGSVLRSGGLLVASDFVNDVPSAQAEEEAILAEVARLTTGSELFGIGGESRIGRLLCGSFESWSLESHPPFGIRHLGKLFLIQSEPDGLDSLKPDDARRLRRRWSKLGARVRREGYTRPATILVSTTRS
ncbi:MAG: class I SAM-dependent methyltransferase, partial [Rubrobacter sp.]